MKILLVNNHQKKSTLLMAESVSAKLNSMGIEVIIDSSPAQITSEVFDAIIVLGGDGTMIRAARQYLANQVPVLGVNMGTVGFLSNIRADELDAGLDTLIRQEYSIDERMMLEIGIYRDNTLIEKVFSLNELSIKSKSSRMMSMDIHIGGRKHGTYRGDGLIIATPTGSTAYTLSAGGPITDPDLEVFVMTPISSYILNKRPMVIAAQKEISIFLMDSEEALIYIDGQVKVNWVENCVIKVKKAEHKWQLVNMRERFFFQTINKRLQRNHE